MWGAWGVASPELCAWLQLECHWMPFCTGLCDAGDILNPVELMSFGPRWQGLWLGKGSRDQWASSSHGKFICAQQRWRCRGQKSSAGPRPSWADPGVLQGGRELSPIAGRHQRPQALARPPAWPPQQSCQPLHCTRS